MSLFVRKLIKPGYEIISSDSNHIWLKLKKELFGDDEDLYICFVYVHPLGSPWQISSNSLNFEIIENKTAKFQMLGKVMVIGDMNGRTNEVEDYIVNDSIDPYLPTLTITTQIINVRGDRIWTKAPSKVTEDQLLNTVGQLV